MENFLKLSLIWINSKIVNHKLQSTDLYVSILNVKYTCILLNLLCKKIKIKRVYQHTIKTELSRPFLALKLNVQIFFKIVGLTRDLPPFSKILLYYCLSINWMHSVYSQIRPFLLTLLKKWKTTPYGLDLWICLHGVLRFGF